jgi:putative FmdB family regulatory protein
MPRLDRMTMPKCQYLCLDCGHAFEASARSEGLDEDLNVECPVCGGTDVTRTFDEGSGLDENDLKEPDDDEGDLEINLDDE